ncbi:MAG: DMP19 family protein [Bacteroidales bacterium]|nr:DMP19 family protein [Bacteroidales bacterium]
MTKAYDCLEPFCEQFFNKLEHEGFDELNDVEKTFICIWSFQGEVDNGGFDQWLFNSSGDWALETITSLQRVGAAETLKMVKKVVSYFPGGTPPKDINKRRELIESMPQDISDAWSELDDQFYNCGEDLENLLADYIQKTL